jgi:hypothetical protein
MLYVDVKSTNARHNMPGTLHVAADHTFRLDTYSNSQRCMFSKNNSCVFRGKDGASGIRTI